MSTIMANAVSSIRPGSSFVIRGGVLEWADKRQAEPTKLEITKAIKTLKKKHKEMQYSVDRQAAYAQLNQDEMRYDDLINGTTTWQDTIAAIKAKHPKTIV